MTEYTCEVCSKKYKFKASFDKHVITCKSNVKEPAKEQVKEQVKEPEQKEREYINILRFKDCDCEACDRKYFTVDIVQFYQELKKRDDIIDELQRQNEKFRERNYDSRVAFLKLLDLLDSPYGKNPELHEEFVPFTQPFRP